MRWPAVVTVQGTAVGNPTAVESADHALPRFTAPLTTQAERKPVMSTAYDDAAAAVDSDIVNSDKRKSASSMLSSANPASHLTDHRLSPLPLDSSACETFFIGLGDIQPPSGDRQNLRRSIETLSLHAGSRDHTDC